VSCQLSTTQPPASNTASSTPSSPAEVPTPSQQVGQSVQEDGSSICRLPSELDARSLELNQHLNPTMLKPGKTWTLKAGAPLVRGGSQPKSTSSTLIQADKQRVERDKAFDLLDALTKSGSLPLSHTSLHVIVCSTIKFDESIMDTVIQRNINPIEKTECASLVLAGVVHGLPRNDCSALLKTEHIKRISASSPLLFSDLPQIE
jgi:hypothetical protein